HASEQKSEPAHSERREGITEALVHGRKKSWNSLPVAASASEWVPAFHSLALATTHLVGGAFLQPLTVNFARVLVGLFRVVHFGRRDHALFLRPALIDALEAPLHAAARGADRLAVDDNENRIGVR